MLWEPITEALYINNIVCKIYDDTGLWQETPKVSNVRGKKRQYASLNWLKNVNVCFGHFGFDMLLAVY